MFEPQYRQLFDWQAERACRVVGERVAKSWRGGTNTASIGANTIFPLLYISFILFLFLISMTVVICKNRSFVNCNQIMNLHNIQVLCVTLPQRLNNLKKFVFDGGCSNPRIYIGCQKRKKNIE